MNVRIVSLLVAVAFLLTGLTGCKDDVDKFIGHVDGMAEAAEGAKGDCEKQAKAVETYLKDNESEIKELGKKLKEKDEGTEAQKEAIEKAVKRFEEATSDCPEAGLMIRDLLAALGGE